MHVFVEVPRGDAQRVPELQAEELAMNEGPKNPEICVYVAGVSIKGIYKIGYTSNLQSRLPTIGTEARKRFGNRCVIRLQDVTTIRCYYSEVARGFESWLHTVFRPLVIEGEWFRLPHKCLNIIRNQGLRYFLEYADRNAVKWDSFDGFVQATRNRNKVIEEFRELSGMKHSLVAVPEPKHLGDQCVEAETIVQCLRWRFNASIRLREKAA